jgi:secreted trypsin-like serine protease
MRFAALVAVAALACGQAKTQQRIYGGRAPDQPWHRAVVSLHRKSGTATSRGIFCSGTLIARDLVLTAAHCLDVGTHAEPRPIQPGELAVYLGDNPAAESAPRFWDVSRVSIHPGWEPNTLANDIGLLRLKTAPGPEPVPALSAAQAFAPGEGGERVNFAGFGKTEAGSYNQKLQVDGTAWSMSPTQMFYGQDQGGPCFGDSGGPAFVLRGGKAYVAGVTSYGDGACTNYGVSTRADAYEDWLRPELGPAPAPVPEPVGACGDGVCAKGETCSSCAHDCVRIHPVRKIKICCGDKRCSPYEDAGRCAVDCAGGVY